MVDTCICCGEVIPEGRMICPNCEAELWPKREKLPTGGRKRDKAAFLLLEREDKTMENKGISSDTKPF